MTDFQKIYKQKREEYLDASIGETHDVRVLLDAIKRLTIDQEDFDRVIQNAWDSLRMDADLADALNRQLVEETEARRKAAKTDKKQGEVAGQTKLVIDDGSLAVPVADSKTMSFDDINQEIEKLSTDLGMTEPQLDALVNKMGRDGMKLVEEQIEVFIKVLDHLRDAAALAKDKATAAEAAAQCSKEILVAVRESVTAGDIAGARAVLEHHFKEVLGVEEPGALVNSVIFFVGVDQPEEQPLMPEDVEVLLVGDLEAPELPEFNLTAEQTEALMTRIRNHEAPLAVMDLENMIADALPKHDADVRGLVLERTYAAIELAAEQESKAAEELNDLEKAAKKKAKAAAAAAKKPATVAKKK